MRPHTVALGLAFLLSFGCGSGDRAAVSGRVTLDGAPLKEGAITFIPIPPNQGATAGGTIRDGQYQIAASEGPRPGANRVEIRGAIRTGRTVPDPRMPKQQMEEVLNVPRLYHSPSELTRDLNAGSNSLDFELRSQGGP